MRAIQKTLNHLICGEILPASTERTRSQKDFLIARAYGLPEIHKMGNPLRMIVSRVGSPSYTLSKWTFTCLRAIRADSKHSIANSLEFIECIKHISVAPNNCLVSFDAVSLFTNTSLGLARGTIIDLLDHCFSNYLQFDYRFYQQIKSTPMGSPIS